MNIINQNFNQLNIIKEKKVDNALRSLNTRETEFILKQMKNCVCRIYKNGIRGTGFFCRILYPNSDNYLFVLATNNHVLNEGDIQIGKEISFSWNNDTKFKAIKIDSSRKVYTSPESEYDTTFIQIFEKDGINNFLEIDGEIYRDEIHLKDLYANLYILNYQDDKNVLVSYGNMINISGKEINHLCNTTAGSSGSPILSLKSLKVIGIHFGAPISPNYNLGTFIKYPILKFIEFITIKKIKSNNQFNHHNDKNKKILEKSIKDGLYNIIPCHCQNMALDINGADKENLANLQIYERNKTMAQKFEIKYNSINKYYTIKCLCSNKFLTVDFENNYNIIQYEENHGCNQQWHIVGIGEGKYEIISEIGFLMDVNGNGNNSFTNVSCRNRNGGLNQKFIFIPTSMIQYFERPSYTGGSIVDALKSINVDSSYSYREKIANANDINNYKGEPFQNILMLKKLKNGELIIPNL